MAIHNFKYYSLFAVSAIIGLGLFWHDRSKFMLDKNCLCHPSNVVQQTVKIDHTNGTHPTTDRKDSPHKKILFWTSFYKRPDFEFGFGRRPFLDLCTQDAGFVHQRCETTSDRNQLDTSDAVVIHIRDMYFEDLPQRRKPEQVWVFFLQESPDYTLLPKRTMKRLNGIFNWTMTYRRDSDVPNGYFDIKRKTSTDTRKSKTEWPDVNQGERRLVAWLVSHCQTSSKREKYVQELKQFIPIDVYGDCGAKCPGNSSKECLDFIFSHYKFYLSFENSLCNDYVTEKFSNALERGVVPIVYGGADYNAIAPPNSFINTKDFESPQHLAEYIQLLNSTEALYLNYFRWRQDYKVSPQLSFCHLCDKLHETDMGLGSNHKVYEDMVSWWYGKGECHTTS